MIKKIKMTQQEFSIHVQNDNNNTEYNINIPSIIVPHITRTLPPPFPTINLLPGHPTNIINHQGVPPSNEEVTDQNAPPPSYDSLFGRMIEAQKISKRAFDFASNIENRQFGTIGCTIISGVTIAMPLSMMIIGGMYLYDCPQSKYIPAFLLAAGSLTIFKQLLYFLAKLCQCTDERSPKLTFINCFLVVWFIFGSVWVYEVYEPNYDPALGEYCNKTLYLFAFWLITLVYIILGILTVGLCCLCLVSCECTRHTTLIQSTRVMSPLVMSPHCLASA